MLLHFSPEMTVDARVVDGEERVEVLLPRQKANNLKRSRHPIHA